MLTIDEVGQLAPAALAIRPAPHCSPKYTMIPTLEVISALSTEGFVPVAARQDSVKSAEQSPDHCRHMVRFRLTDTEHITDRASLAVLAAPEIVLLNSSDGRAPFSLNLGMWRKVCSNGLIVAQNIDGMATRHKGVTAASVIETARQVSRQSKPLFDKIKRWSALPVSEEMQREFGARAAQLRWGASGQAFDPMEVIKARRDADIARTLWNIFNCAQETGMRGGISGQIITAAGRPRALSARPLSAIAGEMEFNASLWTLAEEFSERL